MAARVNTTDVRSVIATGRTDAEITSAIQTATVLVDDLSTTKLSASRLREIEKWLSAHFVSVSDPYTRLKEEKSGQAFAVFSGKSGMGLDFTEYGQQAMALDTTGDLRKASTLKKASIDFTHDNDLHTRS